MLPLDSALLREQLLRQVEEGLSRALDAARRAGLGREELIDVMDGLMRTESEHV
ncbi:hypothetical protein HDA40_002700 [Hamadaea flava]|uniref:Uncharacterized protein n=1 Tax=Hamadaea flava TaxID=1742688 RepID=A0ABV8LMN8_9ACTN|nr:hypothetical protein [Hamadaea flava]MCP2324193.1 hypothetical protein [Hamadaea flava]